MLLCFKGNTIRCYGPLMREIRWLLLSTFLLFGFFFWYHKMNLFKDWSTLFLFVLGNERTLVTCKSCEAGKNVYSNPYLYVKAMENTPKNQKNRFQFFRHVISVFHWKIFATVFLCIIADKCHENVNIYIKNHFLVSKNKSSLDIKIYFLRSDYKECAYEILKLYL